MVALTSPGRQVPRQTRWDETISKGPLDSDDVGPGAYPQVGKDQRKEVNHFPDNFDK